MSRSANFNILYLHASPPQRPLPKALSPRTKYIVSPSICKCPQSVRFQFNVPPEFFFSKESNSQSQRYLQVPPRTMQFHQSSSICVIRPSHLFTISHFFPCVNRKRGFQVPMHRCLILSLGYQHAGDFSSHACYTQTPSDLTMQS